MRLFLESIDFISASVIGADLSLVLATGSEWWNFEGFLFFHSNKAWCEEETDPPPLKYNKLPKWEKHSGNSHYYNA